MALHTITSAAARPPSGADDGLGVATQDLTRVFGRGRAARTVVDSLHLAVPRGSVYGFLGPNGSGKSTTMKMLLGLLEPTRGEVSLLGERLTPATRGGLMARTGSMIEQAPGYRHLTGAENMEVLARMLDLSQAQVDRALELVRLTEHKDRPVRTYSLGMKQRLGIAMALAREPELLILDEPTNGLDPAGIEEIRRLLVSLAAEGVTVLVSSHLLDEIDRMASVLGILSAGRLVFQGTRTELMERTTPALRVVIGGGTVVDGGRWPERGPLTEVALHVLLDGLTADPRSAKLMPEGFIAPGLSTDAGAELVRRLVAAGLSVHEVHREALSLEDVFMELTGGAGAL